MSGRPGTKGSQVLDFHKKYDSLKDSVRKLVLDRFGELEVVVRDLCIFTAEDMGAGESTVRGFIDGVRNNGEIDSKNPQDVGLYRLSVLLYYLDIDPQDLVVERLRSFFKGYFEYPPKIKP